ncbi:MAG: DUF1579 family protein [Planctomycetota bacterium]
MPKMTIAEMKAQMPPRPVELDRLEAFVGKWESEGTAKFEFLDQPLKMTGNMAVEWSGDRWYLIWREKGTMQEFDPMESMSTWTYDVKAKKYRAAWGGSMGMTGIGDAKYDVDDNVWRMTATSYGPWGKSCMKGTMRFVNPDTMEWSMTEHMGLMKIGEMSGTARRVK